MVARVGRYSENMSIMFFKQALRVRMPFVSFLFSIYRRLLRLWQLFVVIAMLLFCCNGFAADFESFLEPAHRVDLVPANRDIIEKIHVAEGDIVRKNQLLVSLSAEVLKARLQAADIMAAARGRLETAKTMEKMRRDQAAEMARLAQQGSARPKELDRAKAELAIAEVEVITAQEEIRIRAAERQQIKAQLAEKEIRSPIDGTVTHLGKEEGEITGTSDQAVLVTVVQEQPLRAVFHLPLRAVNQLSVGQQLPLVIGEDGTIIPGEVEYISSITNPESGTVKVKIKIKEAGKLQSGLRCRLNLGD